MPKGNHVTFVKKNDAATPFLFIGTMDLGAPKKTGMEANLEKLKRVNMIVLQSGSLRLPAFTSEEQALLRWFIKGKVKRHPDINDKWAIVRGNIRSRLEMAP